MEQGQDQGAAGIVAALFTMMERGVIADTTDDLATLLGREPRTFEQYVVRVVGAGAWRAPGS